MTFQGRDGVSRPLTVSECLVLARERVVDIQGVSAALETALQDVCGQIEAQPEGYIMSQEEYAVLNYFQVRWKNKRLFQQAVFRFWKTHRISLKAAATSTTPIEMATKHGADMPPPGYSGPDSMSTVLQISLQGLLLYSRFPLTRLGHC